MSIATLDTIEGETFLRLETPTFPITNAVQEEYGNIEKTVWYKLLDNGRSKKDRDPYQCEIDQLEQKLAQHYAPLIAQGNRIQPSQLRSYVPCLKNSYEQTLAHIFISEENEDITIVPFFTTFHCASVVFVPPPNKEDIKEKVDLEKNRLTRITLEQQKAVANCKKTNMTTLNSLQGDVVIGTISNVRNTKRSICRQKKKKKPLLYDREIVLLTKHNADATNGIYESNICLNGFRIIFKNHPDGIKEILDDFKKIYDNAKTYQPSKMDKKIELFGYFLGKCYENLTLGVIYTLFHLKDKEVVGLDLIAYFNILASLNNEIVSYLCLQKNIRNDQSLDELHTEETTTETTHELDTVASWFGCASGENRTVVVSIGNPPLK